VKTCWIDKVIESENIARVAGELAVLRHRSGNRVLKIGARSRALRAWRKTVPPCLESLETESGQMGVLKVASQSEHSSDGPLSVFRPGSVRALGEKREPRLLGERVARR